MDWKGFLNLSDETIDDVRIVGYCYVRQGCFDIALDYFKALIIIDPKNIYDLQTLGSIYLEKGKYLEALKFLDKSLKINPQNDMALLNKARALFAIGYRREGLEAANILQKKNNVKVASQAQALIKAYS
ncbi:MAG: hypothetical protein A3F40_03960 [Chlamydiae bacterium RIFCSPHIGHO2_12_FULL_27_8]|nr:MAG: hypothetical protein A3F40_03960 [Chlamydiae bacterium RIFCSPHIGHO2_12_FULL_27_8]